MKLRIKSNTLRLRLSQDEVSRLCQDGSVFDICHFGDNHLTYGIRHHNGEEMKAEFSGPRIVVDIPKGWTTDWDQNDLTGFEVTDEEGLFILVEKDFQCLKPREGEDETNLYPNTQA